jgi:hypothetical protein
MVAVATSLARLISVPKLLSLLPQPAHGRRKSRLAREKPRMGKVYREQELLCWRDEHVRGGVA